jgi:hypothetical protein
MVDPETIARMPERRSSLKHLNRAMGEKSGVVAVKSRAANAPHRRATLIYPAGCATA